MLQAYSIFSSTTVNSFTGKVSHFSFEVAGILVVDFAELSVFTVTIAVSTSFLSTHGRSTVDPAIAEGVGLDPTPIPKPSF